LYNKDVFDPTHDGNTFSAHLLGVLDSGKFHLPCCADNGDEIESHVVSRDKAVGYGDLLVGVGIVSLVVSLDGDIVTIALRLDEGNALVDPDNLRKDVPSPQPLALGKLSYNPAPLVYTADKRLLLRHTTLLVVSLVADNALCLPYPAGKALSSYGTFLYSARCSPRLFFDKRDPFHKSHGIRHASAHMISSNLRFLSRVVFDNPL
jgi:hypothetical protein